MTNQDTKHSYDTVPYPAMSFSFSSPAVLAARGVLLGLTPPPVEDCRVLEIGCGRGTNLMFMAEALPNSEFLGIDLSQRHIDDANAFNQKLGFANLHFVQMDIMDFPAEMGQFDYIIAHGVYSWVPETVRAGIVKLCQQHLAPQGLAYASYNVYPGWFNKRMLRETMLYHTRTFQTPEKRLQQAKAILSFLANATKTKADPYALYLQEALEDIKDSSDGYLFHEYLEVNNEPVFFNQFVEQVQAAGLNYLGDIYLSSMMPEFSDLEPDTIEQINVIGRLTDREQYLDLLTNRTFRHSLLTHQKNTGDYELQGPALIRKLRQLYCWAAIDKHQLPATGQVIFRHRFHDEEIVITEENQRLQSILEYLAQHSVSYFTLDSLARQFSRQFTTSEIADILLQLHFLQLLEFYSAPLPLSADGGTHPTVSQLARQQILAENQGDMHFSDLGIQNLNGDLLELELPVRRLLPLLDGQHTRQTGIALLQPLVEEEIINFEENGVRLEWSQLNPKMLDAAFGHFLDRLAKSGLLKS